MVKIVKNCLFILFIELIPYVLSEFDYPVWEREKGSLKLLQIVHRHGERTVLKDNLPKNDPFKDKWWQGFGQLTNEGKIRMFRMGKYLRQWYSDYLDIKHSPRNVYVRSSIENRCIESVSCLLSGMYPPNDSWIWESKPGYSLGQIWQPFPIQTFMPKDEDTLLVPHKKCPKANDEHSIITNSEGVQQIVNDLHITPIYKWIVDNIFHEPINTLYRGQQFWDTLKIENFYNYTWPNMSHSSNYTQDQVIEALKPLGEGSYIYDWNRPFILKIRLGKLIETLISNIKSAIEGQSPEEHKELYIYSTHDSIVVPLMQALGPYNNMTPPYGGALLFELHDNEKCSSKHSIRIYYYNNTDEGKIPEPFIPSTPGWQCFETFESNNRKWFYTDFDKECGLEKADLLLSEMTFLVIGIGIGIGLIGLNIFALKYIKTRNNSFGVSK